MYTTVECAPSYTFIQVKETRELSEKSHHVRHASSTFYIGRSVPEEAAHVSEGWLYKRGKIVRNWKPRWFILDTEKGNVSFGKGL